MLSRAGQRQTGEIFWPARRQPAWPDAAYR